MATKNKRKTSAKASSTRKYNSVCGFKTGMSGFAKNGKNSDGKNVTFDELVHYVQKELKKDQGVEISLDLIKNTARYLGIGIADNLAKDNKVCVSIPYFGSFKTAVRKYSVAGKSGSTKTVRFTPGQSFKDNAKLGAK